MQNYQNKIPNSNYKTNQNANTKYPTQDATYQNQIRRQTTKLQKPNTEYGMQNTKTNYKIPNTNTRYQRKYKIPNTDNQNPNIKNPNTRH